MKQVVQKWTNIQITVKLYNKINWKLKNIDVFSNYSCKNCSIKCLIKNYL